MAKMITIIVPVYNVEKFIVQLLSSLDNLSYKFFEVIFVNDCSLDTSVHIIEDWIAKTSINSKIVSHDVNRGLSAARNTGIQYASGDFITFVDSDDFLNESFLSFFNSPKIDENVVYLSSVICYDNPLYFCSQGYNPIKLQSDLVDNPIMAWGKFYPIKLFKEKPLLFTESLIFEDEEFNFRLNSWYPSLRSIYKPSSVYFYRRHQHSIMGSAEKYRSHHSKIIELMVSMLEERRSFELAKIFSRKISEWLYFLNVITPDLQEKYLRSFIDCAIRFKTIYPEINTTEINVLVTKSPEEITDYLSKNHSCSVLKENKPLVSYSIEILLKMYTKYLNIKTRD